MSLKNDGETLPKCITKKTWQTALENDLGYKNIHVESFDASLATATGENYTSKIYRVTVKYKTPDFTIKEESFIVKHIKAEANVAMVLDNINVLDVEEKVYLEINPKIEALIGESVGPRCCYSSVSEQVLIFQDLKAMGFTLADRFKGLDMKHCEIVLKRIGEYHGASMALIKKDPTCTKGLDKGLINEHTKDSVIMTKLFLPNLQSIPDVVSAWPGFESIATKLKKLHPSLAKLSMECVKLREDDINVINHGDLWVNNMLFKYDNNNIPYNVSFVDFQLTYYGSLGLDLNYFLISSAQLDVLQSNQDELLKIYYNSLKNTLEKCNYTPIPSWLDVQREIFKKEFYGFLVFVGILPVTSTDLTDRQKSTGRAIGDGETSQKNRELMFSTTRMKESLKYMLKRFDAHGILDQL